METALLLYGFLGVIACVSVIAAYFVRRKRSHGTGGHSEMQNRSLQDGGKAPLHSGANDEASHERSQTASPTQPYSRVEDLDNGSDRDDNLRDAIFAFEEIDKLKHLHSGIAIICFLVSAGVGVKAFFLMIDFMAWLRVSEFVASVLVSMAWVALIVIWIFAFLLMLSVLDAMGVRDLRSVARNRLSNLDLGLEQLHELREVVGSRNWKHDGIFRSVVADLSKI